MNMRVLTEALRATGEEVCLKEANRLDALGVPKRNVDLHLRRVGLDRQDALKIATAIDCLSDESGPSICSLSISCNPDIKDKGAIDFTESLPPL